MQLKFTEIFSYAMFRMCLVFNNEYALFSTVSTAYIFIHSDIHCNADTKQILQLLLFYSNYFNFYINNKNNNYNLRIQ